MPDSLAERFAVELFRQCERAKKECNYNATRFLQMFHEQGAISTARQLIMSPNLSRGFISMWERKRLDLTIEALIIREPWRQLFTCAEVEIATKRLEQSGYKVKT